MHRADDDAAAHRGPSFHLLAAAVAVLLAVAVTWPLVTAPGTHYCTAPGMQEERRQDLMLTSWIIASDLHRLAHDPLHVFDTNNMHPFHLTLAYSENLLGVALPLWPVHALFGNPVLTDNVALLMILALSAYGVVLLVHELTGSTLAALVAALCATWTPGVWANLDQMHAVAGQSTALALFALVRLVRTRAWRWSVALGLLTAWQLWATLHWGLFLALGLTATVVVLLLLDADARRAWPQIAVAGLLAAALAVPLAIPYLVVAREMDLRERGAPMFLYIGVPVGFVPALLQPWTYFAERWASTERGSLMLTITPVYVAAAGLVTALIARRTRRIPPWLVLGLALGGVVTYWYALGPVAAEFGLPDLYKVAGHFPGLGILRAPARAVQYTALILAVLAGCGLAALLRRVPWPAARVGLAALVAAGAVLEAGWEPGSLVAAPPPLDAASPALAELPPDCAIATIPSSYTTTAVGLLQSTAHWHGMVNGRSGVFPIEPPFDEALLNLFPADEAVRYLRDAGACAVIAQKDAPGAGVLLDRATKRQLPMTPVGPTQTLIRLPDRLRTPPDAPTLSRTGWRVVEPPDAGALLDGLLDTVHTLSVTAGKEPERLVIDMGRTAAVSGIDLQLGAHWMFFMRTYRVEGSFDGNEWFHMASTLMALPPLSSYRADRTRIVQLIRFQSRQTRFLRLSPYRRPLDWGPDMFFSSWGAAEIEARGMYSDEIPRASPDAGAGSS